MYSRNQLETKGRLLLHSRSGIHQTELFSDLFRVGHDQIITGDIRSFQIPKEFTPRYIIHCATSASAALNSERPLEMIDVIYGGQKRVLEVAAELGVQRVLFPSSGAVYGKLPKTVTRFSESFSGAPDLSNDGNAYHEAKRLAELMGVCQASRTSVEFVSARMFAFLAPLLPLDRHFAAGNFLRDALRGGPIKILGSGRDLRSYMYGSDMVEWLWKMLINGRNMTAYNCGGDIPVSVLELAQTIAAEIGGNVKVHVENQDSPVEPNHYLPDVSLAKTSLGVSLKVNLAESVRRYRNWFYE